MRNKYLIPLVCGFLIVCVLLAWMTGYCCKCFRDHIWAYRVVRAIENDKTEYAIELIQLAKEKNYNVNSTTSHISKWDTFFEASPTTPISAACRMSNVACLRALLHAGASVNTPEGAGWNPLYSVITRGYKEHDVDIVKLLMSQNTDLSQNGAEPIILQAAGRTVYTSIDGEYEYNAVAAESNSEVFMLLITQYDPYVTDALNRNALYYAVQADNLPLCRILIENYGFDVTDTDRYEKTILEYAVEGACDYVPLMEYLLSREH